MPDASKDHLTQMFLVSYSNKDDQVPLSGDHVHMLDLTDGREIVERLFQQGTLFCSKADDHLHPEPEGSGIYIGVIPPDHPFAALVELPAQRRRRVTCRSDVRGPGGEPGVNSHESSNTRWSVSSIVTARSARPLSLGCAPSQFLLPSRSNKFCSIDKPYLLLAGQLSS